MDTGDALLQAIIDEPDDDALRLIYADWLQDHGQPGRAEFIRLDVALHARDPDGEGSTPSLTCDPEGHRIGTLRNELLGRHGKEWFGDVARLVGHYEVERGFVSYFDTTARRFATQADRLFAAAPLAYRVYLNRLGTSIPAVAARPELARLRELGFSMTTIDSAGIQALCQSPHLRNLRQLTAAEGRIGPEGCIAIARATNLRNLEELDLDVNPLYDGANLLFASEILAGLRCLQLCNCEIGDLTLRDLGRTEIPPVLIELHLGYNNLTSRGAQILADCPRLASLERLVLYGNQIGDDGALALARSTYLGALKSLDLSRNLIGDSAQQALVARFGTGVCTF
jgi:uncharacterized protein (TIGR02996 family)